MLAQNELAKKLRNVEKASGKSKAILEALKETEETKKKSKT